MSRSTGDSHLSHGHQPFTVMLPAICRHATREFRRHRAEARSEMVAEAVALAFLMYVHLVRRGRQELAYATPLAVFACRQVRAGRRLAGQIRRRDLASRDAPPVKRLDRFDSRTGAWREAVVADHRTPVPDQAAFNLDFPAWLSRHTRRNRRIALALAMGESPGKIARRHRLSPSRITQLRQAFAKSWHAFHGD